MWGIDFDFSGKINAPHERHFFGGASLIKTQYHKGIRVSRIKIVYYKMPGDLPERLTRGLANRHIVFGLGLLGWFVGLNGINSKASTI